MDAIANATVSAGEAMSPPPPTDFSCDMVDTDRLKEICASGALHFDDSTWLISEIEKSFPDDIEKLCLVYDAFLSGFPLCHGYWRRYAYHKIRLCTVEKAVEVFERAVEAATYSVPIWVDYCTFAAAAYEDPLDVCRLFERGLSFVGKDYSCYALRDKYIEFLSEQQQWSSLAHIFLQTLRYPSKKLHVYYESFRILAASLKEEIECGINASGDLSSVPIEEDADPSHYTDDDIANIVRDLLGASNVSVMSKSLQAYLSIGERLFQDTQQLTEKISSFETRINRLYFHVKPLDTNQLDNWHEYLDFAELHEDFDWAVKLYERCLIPCANYPEFWIRYVDFVESKGGRELANFALSRATQTFVKNASVIHLFDAWFKERTGNVSAAYAALSRCSKEPGFTFIENVMKKANMEKRLGDFEAADKTYREALEKISAGKENSETLPLLYAHFSRLKYTLTQSADAAKKILMEGIERVPHCKLLLEELIRFTMTHEGSRQIDLLDSIIDKEISHQSDSLSGLSAQDKEYISKLYLELIDLCGTIHDVRKAWKRHAKLFPDSTGLNAYAFPAVSENPLKGFMQRRRENVVCLTQNLSSTDNIIDNPVISPRKDKKELPVDSDGVRSKNTATDHGDCVVQSGLLNSQLNPDARATGLQSPKEHVARKDQCESQLSLERLSLGYKEDEDEHGRRDVNMTSSQPIPKDGLVTKRAYFLTNPSGGRESDAIEIQPKGVQNQNHRDSNPGSQERHPQRKFQRFSPVPGQHQGVVPQTQSSVLQNHQNQSTVSASQIQVQAQTAVAYPQAQTAVQSNEQQGQTESTEGYNQMWQQYYYYYYYYYQQQQLLNQQPPQPNWNSQLQQQQQPDQNLPNLLPEQQQQLLQLHQFFTSQQLQQSQVEPQHPPSQQQEQQNALRSPIQQSQEEQQHIQFQQQHQWLLQQQQQQQQQWFLQQLQQLQQQQPQQQQQQPCPQQQPSCEQHQQQQQHHLYLQYQQQQQQQGEERQDEQKLSVCVSDSQKGTVTDERESGQEHGAGYASVLSKSTGSHG
ncbi:PREDICTED: uncharacterized protein LOC104806115 [Tarenaya hassleriana]|uniref:uncharacterized protein LOC104806115 n=1 Tax=Tarenaya hassleriana TaxID=28532 RepID=UPI00053C675A|nr:PREDICTED: uncharacterized protein LOC104806115 [Tarenaya hassleriana]